MKTLTRKATSEEITALRKNATLTGFPKNEIGSPKDSRPFARHFVKQATNGQIIAGCSFIPSKYKNDPAWELYAVTNHSSFLINMMSMFGKVEVTYEHELIKEAAEILLGIDPTVIIIWSDVPEVVAWVYKNYGWQHAGEKHPDTDGKLRPRMFKKLD